MSGRLTEEVIYDFNQELFKKFQSYLQEYCNVSMKCPNGPETEFEIKNDYFEISLKINYNDLSVTYDSRQTRISSEEEKAFKLEYKRNHISENINKNLKEFDDKSFRYEILVELENKTNMKKIYQIEDDHLSLIEGQQYELNSDSIDGFLKNYYKFNNIKNGIYLQSFTENTIRN